MKACNFEGRNGIIVLSHDAYDYVEVGDDMHMNGMDAPAKLNREGAIWLIDVLQKHFQISALDTQKEKTR